MRKRTAASQQVVVGGRAISARFPIMERRCATEATKVDEF